MCFVMNVIILKLEEDAKLSWILEERRSIFFVCDTPTLERGISHHADA